MNRKDRQWIEAERGRLEGLGYVFVESATENDDGAVHHLVQVTLDNWALASSQAKSDILEAWREALGLARSHSGGLGGSA